MVIKQKFDCVEGSFETDAGNLVCVRKDKYAEVTICFKENMNIPFAKIRLHSKDLFVDAEATMDDAYNLGNEICKRWNEYGEMKRRECPKCGNPWPHHFRDGSSRCEECNHYWKLKS